MNQSRRPEGVPLPSLGSVLLTVIAVCGGRLLWIEYQQRTVATPTAELRDNPVERIQRIEALVEEGPTAAPELTELLSNIDPKVRTVALYGLGRLKQSDSLPAIRRCLSDQNPEVRRSALSVFVWICEDAEEAIAVAARMIDDPAVAPRNLASNVLDTFGTASIPAITELSHSPNAAVRIAAVELLTKIDRQRRDPSEVNALLRGMVDDDDPLVRLRAIEAVASRGAATVEDAAAWLADDTPAVVNAGYRAVHAMRENGVRLLPRLQDRLTSLDSRFPDQVQVLRALKHNARPAAPAVMRLIPSLNLLDQTSAIETLRVIGAETDELIRIVIPLLSASDGPVREAAGRLLVQISPEEARRQVDIQVRHVNLKQATLSGDDFYTLQGLGAQGQAAVPLLIRLLADKRTDVARQSLLVLREIGEPAAPAVPALQSMLRRPDLADADFGLLVQTVGAIGPPAAPVVPRLLETLNRPVPNIFSMPSRTSKWPDRQIDAAWALGRIGDDSPAIRDSLRKLMNIGFEMERMMPGETFELRRTALESLARLTHDAEPLLDDLLARLEDRSGQVRMQAALAIGLLPGDRKRAVKLLTAALFDRNCYVRTAAAQALHAIGPVAAEAAPALAESVRDTRNHVPNSLMDMSRPAPRGLVAFGDDLEELSVAVAASRALAAVSAQVPDSGVASQ